MRKGDGDSIENIKKSAFFKKSKIFLTIVQLM